MRKTQLCHARAFGNKPTGTLDNLLLIFASIPCQTPPGSHCHTNPSSRSVAYDILQSGQHNSLSRIQPCLALVPCYRQMLHRVQGHMDSGESNGRRQFDNLLQKMRFGHVNVLQIKQPLPRPSRYVDRLLPLMLGRRPGTSSIAS